MRYWVRQRRRVVRLEVLIKEEERCATVQQSTSFQQSSQERQWWWKWRADACKGILSRSEKGESNRACRGV
jgi:hypothetical protein